MSDETVHTTVHEIEVRAPAEAVFDLVAEASRWPVHFPPSVHVERLEGDGPTGAAEDLGDGQRRGQELDLAPRTGPGRITGDVPAGGVAGAGAEHERRVAAGAAR